MFIVLSYLLAATAWIGMARIHGPLLLATILAMTAPLVAAAIAGAATGFLPREPAHMLALVRRAYRPSTRGLAGATLVTVTVVVGVVLTYAVGAEGPGAPRLGGWSPALLAAGLVISFLPACAEEFGWRGFLLDRLHGLHPATAAAVVGLVWGFRHAPAIAGSGFDYGVHRVSGIAAMCLISVPSGSSWPGSAIAAAPCSRPPSPTPLSTRRWSRWRPAWRTRIPSWLHPWASLGRCPWPRSLCG